MIKVKTKTDQSFTNELNVIPPETQYLSESYVLRIPANDQHLHSPWQLRLYALELLEKEIGDEVQLTSLRVKKPRLVAKGTAKLRGQAPHARLFVTIKF